MTIFLYYCSELWNEESDGLLKLPADEALLSELEFTASHELNYNISLNFFDGCSLLHLFICLYSSLLRLFVYTSVYTMCALLRFVTL
jgi:hypothetical protein